MARWEYQTLTVKAPDEQTVLTQIGRDGWEAYSTQALAADGAVIYFLKRELKGTTP